MEQNNRYPYYFFKAIDYLNLEAPHRICFSPFSLYFEYILSEKPYRRIHKAYLFIQCLFTVYDQWSIWYCSSSLLSTVFAILKYFSHEYLASKTIILCNYQVIFEGVYALHPDIRKSLDLWIAVVRMLVDKVDEALFINFGLSTCLSLRVNVSFVWINCFCRKQVGGVHSHLISRVQRDKSRVGCFMSQNEVMTTVFPMFQLHIEPHLVHAHVSWFGAIWGFLKFSYLSLKVILRVALAFGLTERNIVSFLSLFFIKTDVC